LPAEKACLVCLGTLKIFKLASSFDGTDWETFEAEVLSAQKTLPANTAMSNDLVAALMIHAMLQANTPFWQQMYFHVQNITPEELARHEGNTLSSLLFYVRQNIDRSPVYHLNAQNHTYGARSSDSME